eukprot:109539_1
MSIDSHCKMHWISIIGCIQVLNGQRKYGMVNTFCENINCIMVVEDIIHYVFDCGNYDTERDRLMSNIEFIFNLDKIEEKEDEEIGFGDLVKVDKLKFILFPFEDELKDDDVKYDMIKIKRLVDKRISVLKEFCVYVETTNRFAK